MVVRGVAVVVQNLEAGGKLGCERVLFAVERIIHEVAEFSLDPPTSALRQSFRLQLGLKSFPFLTTGVRRTTNLPERSAAHVRPPQLVVDRAHKHRLGGVV